MARDRNLATLTRLTEDLRQSADRSKLRQINGGLDRSAAQSEMIGIPRRTVAAKEAKVPAVAMTSQRRAGELVEVAAFSVRVAEGINGLTEFVDQSALEFSDFPILLNRQVVEGAIVDMSTFEIQHQPLRQHILDQLRRAMQIVRRFPLGHDAAVDELDLLNAQADLGGDLFRIEAVIDPKQTAVEFVVRHAEEEFFLALRQRVRVGCQADLATRTASFVERPKSRRPTVR